MSKLSGPALCATFAILAACGGEEAQGPTEPREAPPILSFAPIQGEWVGTIEESGIGPTPWIKVSLSSGARRGERVGTVSYGFDDPEEDPAVCSGAWIAVDAQAPLYTVEERITSGEDECPDGAVRLEHDPEAGTLGYDFTPDPDQGGATGTGTLTRP